jgi:hypothetical protein
MDTKHLAASFLAPLSLLLASSTRAELVPDWMATIPAGSALTAGLKGIVTSPDGMSYITGINGSSSNTDIVTAAIGPGGLVAWQQVFNGPADWHDQSRGLVLGPGGVLYVTGNTPGPGSYANVLLLKHSAATGAILDMVQYSTAAFTSEYGGSVACDEQGAVYVGGGTVGDGGDGLLLSFDSGGELRWTQTYDGPADVPYSQDQVQQVKIAPDGTVVALIYGVMNSLHPDYVVIKYDPATGEIIWQANWGVNGGDFPRDMEIDAAGDVYVTGTGFSFIDRYSTIKLRGTDGALLWQRYDSIGAEDYAAGLALDGAGGVYITGSSDPDGDDSNLNDNFYTVKRDAATGALVWTHFYGLNCIGCYDVAGDVAVDSAGNVFIVGYTNSPPYNGDMILFMLDGATGAEQDRGIVGGGPNEVADGDFLRFDAAGNLYVGGAFSNVNTAGQVMAVMKYASQVGTGEPCPWDVDGDGQVGIIDFLEVLGSWGPCGGCPADVDGDGAVSVTDLLGVLGAWGPC